MKLIKKNYKKNFLKLRIETLDDLWYLTYIIEKGDVLKAHTYRKIKLGKEDERKTNVIKKPAVISIKVEKIEFSKYSNVLRVSGIISEGPEDIPLGSHHTINLEENSEFSLEKNHLLKYQIDKLEESAKDSAHKILICVHDREEAYFAVLKKYGYEIIGHIKGSVEKKADIKTESSDFFVQIKNTITDYDKRYNFTNIIIASPGFWREYIQRIMNNKKIVYATCSSVGINGINEVIKRPEVKQVLKEEKFNKEIKKVEELLEQISKQSKAEYGLQHIKKATEAGAVSELLITDNYIHKKRQEDDFGQIDTIMRNVESMKGQIHIISSEHEGGKKLDGLGGIAALLRYRLH